MMRIITNKIISTPQHTAPRSSEPLLAPAGFEVVVELFGELFVELFEELLPLKLVEKF